MASCCCVCTRLLAYSSVLQVQPLQDFQVASSGCEVAYLLKQIPDNIVSLYLQKLQIPSSGSFCAPAKARQNCMRLGSHLWTIEAIHATA